MTCGKPPICFGCKHWKQTQAMYSLTPGHCAWQPTGHVPPWLQYHLDDHSIRETETGTFAIHMCGSFEEKNDDRSTTL